jgi:predicted transcriptional regulator
MGKNTTIKWAAKIVSAYTGKNAVTLDQLPTLIAVVHATLLETTKPIDIPTECRTLDTYRSVTPDYIVSLESGRRLKTLKRYLMARYGLTPEQYRKKWNLPSDYPMIAPNYARKRRAIAITNGLGHSKSVQ